jgi:hypothetical protein
LAYLGSAVRRRKRFEREISLAGGALIEITFCGEPPPGRLEYGCGGFRSRRREIREELKADAPQGAKR